MSFSFSIANSFLAILPATRFFGFKRIILNVLGITVGSGTKVCSGVKFYGAGKIEIGKEVWLGHNCKFYLARGASVSIGSFCDIAPDNVFHTGSHQISTVGRRAGNGTSGNISIGLGCWIGLGSTTLAGCALGKGSVVGARTLLLGKSYSPDGLYIGSPAKRKTTLEGLADAD